MTPDYDREKLKEAQNASLRILLEVDRICRENNIKYLMDAGTLLGAVRHKGFIPWDDDIDIAMTRENYELFRKTAPSLLDRDMQLIEPNSYRGGKVFYDFTPRIIYLKSLRHEDSGEMRYYDGKLNHLWVDIFILDNISDSTLKDKYTRFMQKVIYGLAMTKRYSLNMTKYKGLDRLRVRVLTCLGRFTDMHLLFEKQKALSVKFNGKKTQNFYYSNYQPDYLHDTVKREWSENVTELMFEGHSLMAPAGYDEVLREIYGDYMTLPPEESRVPSHSDDIEVLG